MTIQQSLVVSRQLSVKTIFFILVFSLFTIHSALGGSLFTVSAADDEITKIEDAYRDINDIKGTFSQKSYIKDLKRTDTYKGFLFIKRPSKMKWEYRGEKPQEVIINNDHIMIYKSAEKQVFKGTFNRQTYGQAPVALLSGFGKIREEFNVNKKNNKLVLAPKNPMGNIVSIEIEISDEGFPIKSFVVNDTRSNKIEITLKNIEINTGIKDSIFDFSLPEGVSIYEHNP